MEKNVGGIDRIARFVLGPALIIVGVAALAGLFSLAAGTTGLALAAVLLVVGAVLTTTALTQKCPLNSLIGLNTFRSTDTRSSSEDVGPESRSD
jgi:hypothetical protein